MNTQIFCDSLLSTAKIIGTSTEIPIETEISLADYEAPVFKIIKSTMEHLITQKYVSQGKVNIDGFIKLCIYYQAPGEEKISVLLKKIPFQKQIDAENADENKSFICIQGQSQYINTRAQNPTRIDVRGAYLLNIKVYSDTQVNVVTAIANKNICTDSDTISFFAMSGHNTRQFALEDQVDLEEDFAKVIRVNNSAPSPTVTVYQDKLTVKGEIISEIFYTCNNTNDVKKSAKTFLYNQIIDIPGIKENNFSNCDVKISSFGLAQNQDTKKLVANLSVTLDAKTFSKQEMIAVKDAFSRYYEYEKEEVNTTADKNIYNVEKALPITMEYKFSGEYKVYDVIFEISPAKNYFELNSAVVKAKISAHIIAKNAQNEYECFTQTNDVVLDKFDHCSESDEIFINFTPVGVSAEQKGDTVTIKTAVSAQGFVIQKQPVTLLSSFAENEANPHPYTKEALVLYYANRNERIFDIAKNHFADPQLIKEENNLEEDVLDKRQMLFIPCYRD